MPSNYDNAAWFYDRLSRLVYGRSLVMAHRFLVSYIPAGSSVLIAGGGTGYVLDEITRHHPSGLTITYVEVSAKMMALSQKRNTGGNQVLFVNQAIEYAGLDQYNVIFTPFLFDNFSQPQFEAVFRQLHSHLLPGGLWLNADFQLTGKWWQGLLLQAMFRFFKLLGCVDVNRLPDIKGGFSKYNYQPKVSKTFFGQFIRSSVYSLN
jgi:ubiquinone/menaquinone biosynthesis C-methylase UbiE